MSNEKSPIKKLLRKTKLGARYLDDLPFKVMLTASVSFAFNAIFAIYNQVLGLLGNSLWFLVLSGYYMILGAMRIGVVLGGRKNPISNKERGLTDNELTIFTFCGILLVVLTFEFAAAAYLSFTRDLATEYDELVMVSVSVYTALRLAFAIRNMVIARKSRAPLLSVIRDISCADAAASVFTLLRSLILYRYIVIDHRISKAVAVIVFLFVLGLGVNMLIRVQRERKKLKEDKK